MRHLAKTLIGVAAAALVLGLAGCGGANNANNSDALVLHVYTVPDGRAKNLSSALTRVFDTGRNQKPVGRAWATGSRQVLVLAPQRMQASIAASIKQIIGKESSQAGKPSPLRLSVWIVDAFPGQGPSDPSLEAIRPALKAFSAATGPAHFVQAHYLSAVSDVGSQTALNPLNGYSFDYTIIRSNGGYTLGFNYRQCQVGLRGQTSLQSGQTLVLGLISDRPAAHPRVSCGADQATAATAKESTSTGQRADQIGGDIHRLLVVRITPVKSS
jgi:hypothetical protein